VGYDKKDSRYESIYSKKVRAGRRRTYFFDVRQTKGEDYYVTLTESTRKFDGEGYSRHKIFLYKEDFNRFVDSLVDVVNHVKTELMPDYDYDEYTRRWEEKDKRRAEEGDDDEGNDNDYNSYANDKENDDDDGDIAEW